MPRIRILGIDPGLRCTGWAVVDAEGGRLRHVAHGECATGKGTVATRLAVLHRTLADVLAAHAPDEVAVERSFVSRNADTALRLGMARGVTLLVPALEGLPIAEYAPTAVKRTVVGAGHAGKQQIAYMVRALLPGCGLQGEEHAADALAVAICHAGQGTGRLAELTGKTARLAIPAPELP